MPNILKWITRPQAEAYQLPEAEALEPERPGQPEDAPPEGPDAVQAGAGERPAPERTAVDFARIQGEAIVADAGRQAEALLREAREGIAGELEQIRAQARQEGYREGYAEGLANALAEAKQRRQAQAVELGGEVRQYLEQAARARDELIDQTRDELRDLAVAVAEKVVRVSLKSSGEIIARMIQGATEKLKRKEWVHIYIAGCDTRELAQITPGLTMSLSAISDHVKIVPMADDESGSCIIEMPDEIIDASASTQLANIRELLSERPGGGG